MHTLPQRFHDKYIVDPETGCWIWTGAKTANGYGRFRWEGRMQRAHRVAYAAANGDIPAGMQVDHICNRPSCIRPDHLQLATPAENVRYAIERDGTHIGARTHCPRGHALTADNLVAARLARGRRNCLTCHRAQTRERTALRDAVASALGKSWGTGVKNATNDPRVKAIVRKAYNWKPASDQEAEELAELVDAVNRIESGRRLSKRQKVAAVYRPPAAV